LRTTAHGHYAALDDQERTMPRTSPFIPGNGKRPPPPAGLDAREAAIWRQITKRLPVDWFVAEPLLKELCRHIRICDDLAGDIARARAAVDEIRGMPEPPAKLLLAAMREYRALLRAHGYQSERVTNLSTKLRLAPQSRYAPKTAKTRAMETDAGVPPWLDWGNDRPQ
jgi:hypothetical protein